MENAIIVPFDLNTARKIKSGEIEGSVLIDNIEIEFGCNHCVNHWGIDLCECGSGARVGECECGSQKAHDTLGIKYDSFGAILKNFG